MESTMKGDTVFLFPPEVDDTWRLRAACIGQADLFFPERGGSLQAARLICDACPVDTECLNYALDTRTPYGIWGGLTYSQRTRKRRRRAVA